MTNPAQTPIIWNDDGVQRLAFFVAEQIAQYVIDPVNGLNDTSFNEDDLIITLLSASGIDLVEPITRGSASRWLHMSVEEAATMMSMIMGRHMRLLILPDHTLWTCGPDAINRAQKDEEYDIFEAAKEHVIQAARAEGRYGLSEEDSQ